MCVLYLPERVSLVLFLTVMMTVCVLTRERRENLAALVSKDSPVSRGTRDLTERRVCPETMA